MLILLMSYDKGMTDVRRKFKNLKTKNVLSRYHSLGHFRCELEDENLSQKMQSTLFTILTFLTFDISPNL